MTHQAKTRSQDLQQSIQHAKDCHQICVETADYSLRSGGHHATADHVRLLTDCAEICATTVNFMLRGSAFYPQMSGQCADICDACATACESSAGDQQFQACASACRSCAKACRKVAQAQPPRA
jgi:hypothetical protein